MRLPTEGTSRNRLATVAIVLVLLPAACVTSDVPQAQTNAVVSTVVGPDGGSLSIPGLTIIIPPGALSEDTPIRLATTGDPTPNGFETWSTIYSLEPHGLVFHTPATAIFDFSGDPDAVSVLWSEQGTTYWEDLGGVVTGNQVTTSIRYFSKGFAGKKPDCSKLPDYPAPPMYDKPAPWCDANDPNRPTNPGCTPATVACTTIPPSGWAGPYNIYKDNCHDAANCGLNAGCLAEQTTGILSCTGIVCGPAGHTVNYTVTDISKVKGAKKKYAICLSEPQRANPNTDKCCWEQDTDVPQTALGQPGHECYKYQCYPQAGNHGGKPFETFQCWPAPPSNPCGTCWSPQARTCCQNRVTAWDDALKQWCTKEDFAKQLDFRCQEYIDCNTSAGNPGKPCGDAGSNTPPPPDLLECYPDLRLLDFAGIDLRPPPDMAPPAPPDMAVPPPPDMAVPNMVVPDMAVPDAPMHVPDDAQVVEEDASVEVDADAIASS